ncbi:MAG: protein kinase [Deltaproteobacteria bacterium]|nr:protein kinase [Deltaproteobacteria bacterium]
MSESNRDDALAATELSPAPLVDRTQTHGDVAKPPATPVNRQVGRYRLDRELGVGGMGIVHAAFDPELERNVAVKLILRATTAEARQRLLREARAMARLTHPNIVTIYEIGSEAGRDFVTMELIDGGSLADWLRAEPRSTRDILDAFLAAGRGLAAAHEAGIVHRDFKPHNVLRSKSGRVVVGDFGLACGLDTQAAVAELQAGMFTTLTATGSWVGTPAYMGPEQWTGGVITPATDQFAYCVALWEAFAGTRPFRGETIEELKQAVIAGPAKLDAARMPRRLRAVLRRGLDPDPASRWPSMAALLAVLRPDRKRLYVGVAALVGAALSISVVVLALTRGAAQPSASASELARAREYQARAEGTVRIAEEARRQATRQVDRAVAGAIELDLDLLADVRRFADGKVMAPQHAIEELVEELQAGKAVQLVPTHADGKLIGFKAYGIKPGTFVDAIGLSNGDVIAAIANSALTSEQALQTALDSIDSQTESLPLEIIRGMQRMTIVVQTTQLERARPGPRTLPVPPRRIEPPPRIPTPPDPPGDPWAPTL